MKLLRLLTKYIPKKIKYKLAQKIGHISFKVCEIGNLHFFDKQLLWLFIKLKDSEKAEKILSNHSGELDFFRFVEDIERLKSFGEEFDQMRLDYKEEDFERILKVNQELVKQFPDDFLLQDRMARNYLAGGYQNKARFHILESLKLQRRQKLKEGKTGLLFIAGIHRGGAGFI